MFTTLWKNQPTGRRKNTQNPLQEDDGVSENNRKWSEPFETEVRGSKSLFRDTEVNSTVDDGSDALRLKL